MEPGFSSFIRIKRRNKALICVISLLVTFLLGRCAYFALKQSYIERPMADSCRQCHKEISHQWNLSPHALAAMDESFLFLTDNANINICQSCHRPKTIWTEGGVMEAGMNQTGVDCSSCHWRDGLIVASKFSKKAERAHALIVDGSLKDDAYMCGICHQRPSAEINKLPSLSKDLSCQVCHLHKIAEEKNKVKKGVTFFKRKVLADHTMRINDLAIFPNAFAFKLNSCELTTTTLSIDFTLINYLPHSVPAVEFGENKVIVTTQVLSEENKEIFGKEEVFHRRKPIEPLSEKKFRYIFELGSVKVQKVALKLFHQRRKEAEKIVMCSEEFRLSQK